MQQLSWGCRELSIDIAWDEETAPCLVAVRAGELCLSLPDPRPVMEVLTVADGHALASDRLICTEVGRRARHAAHEATEDDQGLQLAIDAVDPVTGLRLGLLLSMAHGAAAIRSVVTVANGGDEPVILRSVASWASGLGCRGESGQGMSAWTIHRGFSDWLGEGRWVRQPANTFRFPDLAQELTGHDPRGAFTVVSTGTWSTGKNLPVACVESESLGAAWAWQIEHNGGWRWEVGQNAQDGYVALSGPTDIDHQWLTVLQPGDSFETVPVSVTVAGTFTEALANLTRYRRAHRRPHEDNSRQRVVFNDYMNTLNGDPTTARLLPLIDAAAEVGAEVFCIDAGWYDDGGDWWASVGAWTPSNTRFPAGLGEVIERIRQHGMVPGLWLEPEAVGVHSPLAAELPHQAFLQRAGQRVVEHGRYHLDLRHPAAVRHLDVVVDRLVKDFGVGYFKLDYNINPGAGTDVAAASVGEGLLGHNRALLAWLDRVLDRHPELILENCGSGGMRSDFAMLSRMQLQSTSDQQDFHKLAAIAAAAPMSMLPEQAASWAYPQPEMSDEEVAFSLATGLAGRLYLSGYLNRMRSSQLDLVAEAVAFAKNVRAELADSTPVWPLGLPEWDADWIVLGLAGPGMVHLVVWNRSVDASSVTIPLDALAGEGGRVHVEQAFPVRLTPWLTEADPREGTLRITNPSGVIGARVLRLVPPVDPEGCSITTL